MSKKGGQPKGKGVAKATSSVAVAVNPLQDFLTTLFEQSEARLVRAEQRSSKDVVKNLVAALEPVALALVKEPRSEGLQKHAVKLVLVVNMNSALGSTLSKKIVSIFFTVLADELQSHWKEYGLKESDVHPDYVRIPPFAAR